MSNELMTALELLAKEKKINKDDLFEALKHSLVGAYRKYYDGGEDVEVKFDKNGNVKVHTRKTVVEILEDPETEILLDEAQRISPKYQLGDVADIEITPRDFGRIAAQNAKQMLVQHIREAERQRLFDEYHDKEGEVVTATVQKMDKKGVLIEIGGTETIMPHYEQMPGEVYRTGDKISVLVLEVKNTQRGLQILVSRTHPGLVRRLFEREIPEIAAGTIEIKSIAREAGSRTKIAVWSNDPDVDPMGACVGTKGTRIAAILSHLGSEKIDVIKYSDDPAQYIAESICPAKVINVELDEEEKSAVASVPEFQLSLAIGKDGQNARLAAKLTGWKIDIKGDKNAVGDVFDIG